MPCWHWVSKTRSNHLSRIKGSLTSVGNICRAWSRISSRKVGTTHPENVEVCETETVGESRPKRAELTRGDEKYGSGLNKVEVGGHTVVSKSAINICGSEDCRQIEFYGVPRVCMSKAAMAAVSL